MWREIRLLGESNPIIASMVDVAASGGYYMAMAAQTIVSENLTLIGSIGVVYQVFHMYKGELKHPGIIRFKEEEGINTMQLKVNTLFAHDKNVGAVVVGLDPYLNYYKIQCWVYGCCCLWGNGERANCSWKTINLFDGFLTKYVPNPLYNQN